MKSLLLQTVELALTAIEQGEMSPTPDEETRYSQLTNLYRKISEDESLTNNERELFINL